MSAARGRGERKRAEGRGVGGDGGGGVVCARGVRLDYGAGEARTPALRGVDLDLEAGEFVSLIGPSGCGKTSLLRIIADLESPSGGSVRVNGMTPRRARLSRAYGYAFQSSQLHAWLTAERNVALPLKVMGFPRRERRERARRMLELVGLAGFANHYPWQLSGGMRQRVSIARALSFDAPLLLMDEPFAALDEMERERLNDRLLDLQRRTGRTILFVTHSIAEAVYLSTRILVMTPRPGRIARRIESGLGVRLGPEARASRQFLEATRSVRAALREAAAEVGDGAQSAGAEDASLERARVEEN